MSLQMLCWVIALVLFAVAAFWSPPVRPQLGWLGAAFLTLGFIVGGVTLT
jgi:hypothetical protein